MSQQWRLIIRLLHLLFLSNIFKSYVPLAECSLRKAFSIQIGYNISGIETHKRNNGIVFIGICTQHE